MITKEEKDKLLVSIVNKRNQYENTCLNNIEHENGKIEGANYMVYKFLEVLSAESEEIDDQEKT